jgi:Enolase, C-terminal TIM barrel domain
VYVKVPLYLDTAAAPRSPHRLGSAHRRRRHSLRCRCLTGQRCHHFLRDTVNEQDDWESWEKFTAKVHETVQVVGDDLTVTNIERIQTAADRKACSGLLLKVNQASRRQRLERFGGAIRVCSFVRIRKACVSLPFEQTLRIHNSKVTVADSNCVTLRRLRACV